MKPHRHAWVDCTHNGQTCGLLKCIYCGAKRRQAPKPTEEDK